MLKLDREDFFEHLTLLRSEGIHYTFKNSGSSYYAESEAGKYYSVNRAITKREIGFIHSVKQYIKKNDIHKTIKPLLSEGRYSRIQYFKYSKKLKNEDTIFEVDIDKAYWNMAYRLGIINQEIYEKGLTISKVARLATLGSLAKKTFVYLMVKSRFQWLPRHLTTQSISGLTSVMN